MSCSSSTKNVNEQVDSGLCPLLLQQAETALTHFLSFEMVEINIKGDRWSAGCWLTVTWGNACRQLLFGASCLLTRVSCHTESRVTRHLASNWWDEASAAPVAHFSHFLLGRVCMWCHIWEPSLAALSAQWGLWHLYFRFPLPVSLCRSLTTINTLSSCSAFDSAAFALCACINTCFSIMNLSKWVSWRQRNFFRRNGKHSNQEMGKWVVEVLHLL